MPQQQPAANPFSSGTGKTQSGRRTFKTSLVLRVGSI